MPNPTDEQLKARLAATGYTQDQLNQTTDAAGNTILKRGAPANTSIAPTQQMTPTISLDTLQNPQTPLATPKVESSAPPVADLTSYIDRYNSLYQAQPQEAQLQNVYDALFNTQSQGGRQQSFSHAKEQTGYNARQSEADAAMQRVAELNDQITQARNLSKEQYKGSDALQGFVDARTESIVRKIAAERDRQQAVAELAQGRADRALQLSQQAVDNEFADRTDRMNALVNYGQYLSQQIDRGELRADKTMQRAIEAQTRDYERQQKELEQQKQEKKDIAGIALEAAKNGADQSVIERINNATTIQQAIANAGSALYSPTTTTVSLGNGQTQLIDAKTGRVIATYGTAKADANGFKAPDVKTINGTDMQWNPYSGKWEPITVAGSSQVGQSLSQLEFLRDTTARILGDKEKGYEQLYKKSSQSPIKRAIVYIATGTTGQARLETYVDTLRTNMLTLATDPSIKKFFGPQMSNADVSLMTAAGTTLRPDSQTPQELKAEAERIDDWLNRAETAVRNGLNQSTTQNNVLTAPDGTLVEIVD